MTNGKRNVWSIEWHHFQWSRLRPQPVLSITKYKYKYKYKYRAEQAQVPDAKDLVLRGLVSNPVLCISITVSVLSF